MGEKPQHTKQNSVQSELMGNWSCLGDSSEGYLLDQFSTSPTKEDLGSEFPPGMSYVACTYRAPFFAYSVTQRTYGVSQGCCNHWDCPRCGVIRAKQEYWRMVKGLDEIAKTNRIVFITVTCRGSSLTRKDALAGYLKWTNKFLDACRVKCKRAGKNWIYVQVTELQKRGHPHSHILTTFDPLDTQQGFVEKWETTNEGKRKMVRKPALRSVWLQEQVIRSGLGEQYDISYAASVEATSRYVAKYLFKETALTTVWPKGWKRIRYSQSFPTMEFPKTDAFVLLSREDWISLSKLAVVVKASDYQTWQVCTKELRGSDCLIR